MIDSFIFDVLQLLLEHQLSIVTDPSEPVPTDRNRRSANRLLPGLVTKYAYQPSLTRAGKARGLPGSVMARTKVLTRVGKDSYQSVLPGSSCL